MNYRFTQFTQNTRFIRENEAISWAFEMSMNKGFKINSSGDLVMSGQFWISGKEFFRCADKRNILLAVNLEKIVNCFFRVN